MNKDIKVKWLEALRGGKYKQCKGRLRDTSNGFCCLGVLADVNGESWGVQKFDRIELEGTDDLEGTTYWANGTGLRMSQASTLAKLNDAGKSFSQIADHIEEKL